ncbi:MAG: DUF4358 domain-containing protein [Gemmiger sp.]|nr:DUF4358 domain-containing protein [Gemmiger sp.]
MKKVISAVITLSLCAALLAGCGSTASSAAPSASTDAASSAPASSSEAASSAVSTADSAPADSAATDTAVLDAAAAALEAVNPIANPRAIDDTSLQYDMNLTADNIAAYKGSVTNNQDDCGLVFVAQAKDGQADAVKTELEAYKESLAGNTLYAEFADKVAQAKDARIFVKDNYVVMVIASIGGPDYSAIDTALTNAFA